MKINNINKRLIAGLMGGIMLSTPLVLTSCSNFSYITEEDGNVHLDKDKLYSYNDVSQLEIIVLRIKDKEVTYLGKAKYDGRVTLYYCTDVFTDKIIYDDKGINKIEGLELISHEPIEKYLISYNMLKDKYSKTDLELLFKRIKQDYYTDTKNKSLVKK